MSELISQVKARAQEMAQSGKFIGWRPIAFELRFEPGYQDACEWLFSPSTQEELDSLCRRARERNRRDPAAA